MAGSTARRTSGTLYRYYVAYRLITDAQAAAAQARGDVVPTKK